ncbi:MAG: type II toxin-antitoxin system VapC family toxin [Spirochaetales bacterium]|nr:type II toxin-antitoxin system VapC family toxin [Spirochaetales bacterium]
MIVIDTNVIAYRFITGDKTKMAIKVEQFDADWKVPALWYFEFLNVLATLTKNNIITGSQCNIIWQNTRSFLKGREQSIDPQRLLRISIQNDISAYDACYIALAETLNTKCVTSDKKLVKLFPGRTILLDNF